MSLSRRNILWHLLTRNWPVFSLRECPLAAKSACPPRWWVAGSQGWRRLHAANKQAAAKLLIPSRPGRDKSRRPEGVEPSGLCASGLLRQRHIGGEIVWDLEHLFASLVVRTCPFPTAAFGGAKYEAPVTPSAGASQCPGLINLCRVVVRRW